MHVTNEKEELISLLVKLKTISAEFFAESLPETTLCKGLSTVKALEIGAWQN